MELIKLGMTLRDESTGVAVGIHRTVGVGETKGQEKNYDKWQIFRWEELKVSI